MQVRKVAFTLIELLVVIAIVAMLLAILMPSLSAARGQAKAAVCLSNMKRLGTGMMLYLNSNRDKFPPMRLKKARPTDDAARVYTNRWGRLKPRWQWFLDADEVGPVISPTPFDDEIEASGGFGDKSVGVGGQSGLEMTNKYFMCPSLSSDFESNIRNGAYGYNYQYLGDSRQDVSDRWNNFPVGVTRIRSPGQTVMIGDSRGAGLRHGKHSYSLDPPRLAVEHNITKFGPGTSDVPSGLDPSLFQYSPVEERHLKRGNIVFADGHAKAMSLRDLGYELNNKGIATPVIDPLNETYTASNKLWNGLARDQIAQDHRP